MLTTKERKKEKKKLLINKCEQMFLKKIISTQVN